MNNYELYSDLETYSFGGPGITRSSTPDSDIHESHPLSRYTEQHHRPHRSLSSVPTPRDEMEIEEVEISRHSRAKTRVIEDRGRRSGSARSELLSKADWSSFQRRIDAGSTHTWQAEEDEPDAYTGLNLEYILGSGGSGGPRPSLSSESLVQPQQSTAQDTSRFAGFGFPFKRDAGRRPSIATAEDTFLWHLQRNDENYTLRVEQWTFGKEKADGSGPRLSGLTAGDAAAPTIGPGMYESWGCHMAGRFGVERLAVQCSSRFRLRVVSVSNRYSWNVVLTPNFFLPSTISMACRSRRQPIRQNLPSTGCTSSTHQIPIPRIVTVVQG